MLAAAIVWFCYELFQPFHGSGHGNVTVTIPAHSHIGQIADELGRDGVISSSFFFEVRATLSGDRGNLRAGTYRLKRDMSYSTVLGILTKAPPAAAVTNVTVIPGKTRHQVDALLRSEGVKGSYGAETRASRLLRPSWYGAPAGTDSLEGFLFPDTYQLREPISVPALVADQLIRFRQAIAGVNFAYARSKHLTPLRRADHRVDGRGRGPDRRDRPLVASVIYNRLAKGMPLQLDATTCYIVGGEPCNLSQTSLLNSSSPYNTRIHAGLTPTPIDSPSLASIEAAAHPAHTNYVYFVVTPCGNGAEVFTSNYQQFQKDAQRYQYSARQARRPLTGTLLSEPQIRLGVLGWPVAHSRSPAIQNAALTEVGLGGSWRYQLLPVAADRFDETTRALPAAGFRGANVTIPHKQAALEVAERRDPPYARDRGCQHARVR